MSSFDVVILTDSRYVNPSAPGEYVRNILQEDQLVSDALKNKGLSVSRKDWADPDFDWSATKSILFRSTWDYFDRFTQFQNWLDLVSTQTILINSHSLIKWNLDKHYLNSLVRTEIEVIPTRYIQPGSNLSISRLHDITGWTETVIKPTVGGAGRHTYRIDADNMSLVSDKLAPFMKQESFMLQPFQHSVLDHGEISLVFFGDIFSHAVLKKARPGDFRVQDDFGGSIHKYTPSDQEISFGLRAVHACPELPAYSRVDIIRNNQGKLAVSELELIEPELWFRLNSDSSALLAEEIFKRLA
ncbi:MAG: hypothetical protein CL666_16445 [Balneola sp.]|nr:hypothetical protein [Balneola sp.]